MSDHESRVFIELKKLPKPTLLAMFQTMPQARLPKSLQGVAVSADDLARAIAPVLAKRDFLR